MLSGNIPNKTYCRKRLKPPHLTIMIIHRSIVAATSLVNSLGEGGSSLARQLIREGKLDPMALIVSIAVGVWSGYSIGQTISDLRMKELIRETLQK